MTGEEQKTLMQTIRARLEWTKEGTVKAFPDIHGSWHIVDKPSRTNSSLVRYFTPQYQEGYDPYGQIKNTNMEPEVEELINEADMCMERGDGFHYAKKLYQEAYELTNDAATKATLKEILDNL